MAEQKCLFCQAWSSVNVPPDRSALMAAAQLLGWLCRGLHGVVSLRGLSCLCVSLPWQERLLKIPLAAVMVKMIMLV